MHRGTAHRFAAICLLVLGALWLCASVPIPAQTFTTLHLFGGGGNPDGA